MEPRPRDLVRRRVALAIGAVLLVVGGCSLEVNLLGGREKCWPADPPRAASLWRGILRIDAAGSRIETPEGDVISLLPGALASGVGQNGVGVLTRGSDVVATAGDDITIFGGAGSDGALVACAIEEVHAAGS